MSEYDELSRIVKGEPEEWPMMSATHAGFRLVPAGFFAAHPALDVAACQTPSACP